MWSWCRATGAMCQSPALPRRQYRDYRLSKSRRACNAIAQGMTIPTATHEMGFARNVSFKVCFLDGGAVHKERARQSGSSRTRKASARACSSGGSSRRGGFRFRAGDPAPARPTGALP